MKILALLLIAIMFVGCRPAEELIPSPTPTSITISQGRLLIQTVVVTATPEPTVEPLPTIEPTSTAAPAVAPTPEVLPTLVPLPTLEPLPTLVPLPTSEPVHVTVIVTAIPTSTATPIPTITPTPTQTPTPTATAIPPFVQRSTGKGSWLSDGFNFWNERPIEIGISVTGSGSFSLNAVTPNGCIVDLSQGTAPYSAITMAEPNAPEVCDGLNELGNGTRLAVTAGGSVNWIVSLTQYSQPIPQNPPITGTGTGQNIFGPIRLGQTEMLAIRSVGDSGFQLDVYSLYEADPIVKRVVSVPTSAIGTWLIDVPLGVYMFSINTAPGREWTVNVLDR